MDEHFGGMGLFGAELFFFLDDDVSCRQMLVQKEMCCIDLLVEFIYYIKTLYVLLYF